MSSKWFVIPQPNPSATKRLICLPYAGGSASIYAPWAEYLPRDVELVAIQPPGRANRIFEPAYDNMASLIDELFDSILPLITRPYVFFGHSLGSRVAIELANRIASHGKTTPAHFIASGNRPPHIAMQEKRLSELAKDEFMEELIRLDGTPTEILQNPKLMALYEPTLRADFKIGDNYRINAQSKLDCEASVFGGAEDTGVSLEHLQDWQRHFSKPIKVRQFSGGHFYLDTAQKPLLENISAILNGVSV